VLRILSFMGLGIALIGIGWAYGKRDAGGQVGCDRISLARIEKPPRAATMLQRCTNG
jgi:hypothetical protein